MYNNLAEGALAFSIVFITAWSQSNRSSLVSEVRPTAEGILGKAATPWPPSERADLLSEVTAKEFPSE